MKFNDFPYKRPDAENFFKKCDNIVTLINNASGAKEIKKILDEFHKEYSNFATQYTLTYIRNSVDTSDEFYNKEKEFFDANLPNVQQKIQQIQLALLSSDHKNDLEKIVGKNYFILIENNVKSLSEEILGLMVEASNLNKKYTEINASAKIEWDGKVLNIAQMGKHQENPDRDIRKKAFVKVQDFYDKHKEEYDQIYDDLVKNRHEQAKKLGHDSFTDLSYIRMSRIGYNRDDIETFRNGVRKYIVPVVTEIKKHQKERIGVDKFTFIDNGYMFADGNPTPKGTPEHLMEQAIKMYSEMSPETKEFIGAVEEHKSYDLVAKDNKRLGGYCTDLPDYKVPFIFSNFNGTSGDVDVLTHEAGHAFNSYTALKNSSFFDLELTYETAEVHSMSMEYFADPWFDLFFKEDTEKYRQLHFESTISFIPYGCIVDEFQHFVYDNPDKTPAERNDFWLGLEEKYLPHIDYDDLSFFKEGRFWQRQLHIYGNPFYYIDYCLAQTVALFLHIEMLKDKESAWKKYMYFIENSSKEFFVDLIDNAGIDSPFKEESFKKLADFAMDFLNKK